jgi:multidrug efflux pump subunit AcrB
MASTNHGSGDVGGVRIKVVTLSLLLVFVFCGGVVSAGVFFYLLPWLGNVLQAKPRPALTIEAQYPGANAQVVADTVAAPLEQQVIGVEKMVSMRSQCTDGTCTIYVTFEPGVDLNISQVLVQNRVALAMPVLPDVVKFGTVAVKRKSPGVLLLVSLSSPDNSRDTLFLSNYAKLALQDELARLPGVGDITTFGPRDYGLRVWVDPEKLAAHDLTAADIVQALRDQNVQAGQLEKDQGPGLPITLKPLGRLADLEQIDNLIVKATANGNVVRLRDVARVELGANQQESHASLNGQPVVILGISPTPEVRAGEVSRAVEDKLAQLRSNHPPGVLVGAAFDFTPNLEAPRQWRTPEYLLLDLALPVGASAERTRAGLDRCASLLRNIPGVEDVLALTDNPFDSARNQACILLRLAPGDRKLARREELTQTIRTLLEREVAEMTVRVRDLSEPGRFPRCAYPIELALVGPERDRLGEWAEKVAGRLRHNGQLTDVGTSPGSTPQPQLSVDVDRAQAKALGVSLDNLLTVLQVHLGSVHVNDFNQFGRTWQVTVQAPPPFRDKVEDLPRLKVRNTQGDMVPLAALVQVREIEAPRVLERLNGEPMLVLTANPAPGVSLHAARSLCETVAEEVRKELPQPAQYRLAWLP